MIGYVEASLTKEQWMAQKAFEKLKSEEGREEYLKRTETLRLYIGELMEQLLNEVDGDNRDDEFRELDSQFAEAQTELERYKASFSEENPWIRLFLGMPEIDTLNFKTAKEYVDKVYIIRNEKVELVPMHSEWKELFPKKWLEV